MPHEELAFWHFNVPVAERTTECPDFLLNTTEKDKNNIGRWDSDYQHISWDEASQIIQSNRLELFRRPPSVLRRYRQYVHGLRLTYGSINAYILNELLGWADQKPPGQLFERLDDIKIMYNDWPYGFEPSIVHLVVWTKYPFPVDPETDDLTMDARNKVADFVAQVFESRVGKENVMWFKNQKSLKSVEAVEHFHVLLRNTTPTILYDLTGGHGQPLSFGLPN